MWDALLKVRNKDREALAEDLKTVYRAETEQEAKMALRRPQERWGHVYLKIVARWEAKAYALPAFFASPS